MSVNSETFSILKQKNKEGRSLGTIWKDINQGQAIASSKFAASYKYCKVTWNREEIPELKEHLSNHCKDALANVIRKYMTIILEYQDKSTKRRKISNAK